MSRAPAEADLSTRSVICGKTGTVPDFGRRGAGIRRLLAMPKPRSLERLRADHSTAPSRRVASAMVVAYGETLDGGDMILQALDRFKKVLETHLVMRHQVDTILLFRSHKLGTLSLHALHTRFDLG